VIEIMSKTVHSALILLALLSISSCSPSRTEQCISLRKIIDEPSKDNQTRSYYLNVSETTKKAYEQLNLPDKDLDQIRKGLVKSEQSQIESQKAMIEIEEKAKSFEKEIDRLEFEVHGRSPHLNDFLKAIEDHIKLRKEFEKICPSNK